MHLQVPHWLPFSIQITFTSMIIPGFSKRSSFTMAEYKLLQISVQWSRLLPCKGNEDAHIQKSLKQYEPRHNFQQCGILTSVDSDKPVQPPLKLRNPKRCLVSSLTLLEYSSNKQRLWSDCAYAQVDLRLCWLHIPHCWKSHFAAHIFWQLQEIWK